MNRFFQLMMTLCICAGLTGCGTIRNGTHQDVLVRSEPKGAAVYVDGEDTGLQTPAFVRLERKKGHTLYLHKEGYACTHYHLKPRCNYSALGNAGTAVGAGALTGVVIGTTPLLLTCSESMIYGVGFGTMGAVFLGSTAVDMASGGAYSFPGELKTSMEKL